MVICGAFPETGRGTLAAGDVSAPRLRRSILGRLQHNASTLVEAPGHAQAHFRFRGLSKAVLRTCRDRCHLWLGRRVELEFGLHASKRLKGHGACGHHSSTAVDPHAMAQPGGTGRGPCRHQRHSGEPLVIISPAAAGLRAKAGAMACCLMVENSLLICARGIPAALSDGNRRTHPGPAVAAAGGDRSNLVPSTGVAADADNHGRTLGPGQRLGKPASGIRPGA